MGTSLKIFSCIHHHHLHYDPYFVVDPPPRKMFGPPTSKFSKLTSSYDYSCFIGNSLLYFVSPSLHKEMPEANLATKKM